MPAAAQVQTVGTIPAPQSPYVRRRVYSTATVERRYRFDELRTAPLIVDAIYEGGKVNGHGADPLCKLILRCSNQGGFRAVGGQSFGKCRLLVLSSSGTEVDWPDRLDAETGIYTYYGDNRKPGYALHDTPKKGNQLLADMFGAANAVHERAKTPPILVFTKTGTGRDVRFRGLVVPKQREDEGLVAIWRQTNGSRFQNYRAQFEVLNCRELSREWLNALSDADELCAETAAPVAWQQWKLKGLRAILQAPRTVQVRTRDEQLPALSDTGALKMMDALRERFKRSPHDFEFVAAEIFRMIEPRVYDLEITRKSADGGRDAVGRLRIGGTEGESDGIYADFALEAKAYGAAHGLHVKETSRLISRLRHRQFGVIVTTSFVGAQAYRELREDDHPVVIITASDIVRILRSRSYGSPSLINQWIDRVLADGSRSV